jgi:autotransporter-associated beta strand protein
MQTRLLLSVFLISTADFGNAASATWNLNPVDNNWNNAANWTPAIVPNDQAMFDVSSVSHIVAQAGFILDSIVFNPGASAFTISGGGGLSGAGIVNNSGVVQNFVLRHSASIYFYGSASAGDNVVIDNGGAGTYGSWTEFDDTSTAGSATIINEGGLVGHGGIMLAGHTNFEDTSNAENATIINNPGTVSGALAGNTFVEIYAPGNVGTSTFIANAATVPGADAGWVEFRGAVCAGTSFIANGATIADAQGGHVQTYGGDGYASFTANGGSGSNAQGGLIYLVYVPASAQTIVTANGGTNGGLGGTILIEGLADISLPQFQVFGNGAIDLSDVVGLTMPIGSLAGDGIVLLAGHNLSVGNNNFSTTFSGVIEKSGGLGKAGTGTLTLSGANTYTGGTIVTGGTLRVNTSTSSGTGTGPVHVNGGNLGGRGMIAGPVTMGTGSGPGAVLAPSVGLAQLAMLTLQGALAFKADGTYSYKLNTNNAVADQVIANGVTILSGAQFSFQSLGNRSLPIGTIFTAISNTSANPINGTFGNLPYGSTFTAGQNNFQVRYSGGDGNDLTFTVVP